MPPQFVPDYDPTKVKQKPRQPAPWHYEEGDALDTLVSTYQRQFSGGTLARREQIRPPMAYPWKLASEENSGSTKQSTSSASFLCPPSNFKQLPSTKPPPLYQRAAFTGGDSNYSDGQTGTTTSRAAFLPPSGIARVKSIYPKSQGRTDDGVAFEVHTTQSSAFQAFPINYRPVQPIRPTPNGVGLGGEENGAGQFQTTSRNSYMHHEVKPYIPAPKPKPTIGSLGAA